MQVNGLNPSRVVIDLNFEGPIQSAVSSRRRRHEQWTEHLRIKAFYGTSENAVKTQVWIAVCSYLLVAIVRKRLGLQLNLYTMLQILSVSLFEKIPINQAFLLNHPPSQGGERPKQLQLLDF
jgi:hypothetical protein